MFYATTSLRFKLKDMKIIVKIALIITSTIMMGTGCEKNQTNIDIKSCDLSDMVKTASNLKGTVWFNSSINSYAVHVSIEGSYDSKDIGIACNLPEKYEVDGLKIIFSGKYFKYEKNIFQYIPEETYYTLEVSKIELEENELNK